MDLCFTMGSATGSMLVTISKVVMVGSSEEVDAKQEVVNVRGGVREDAKNAKRSTLPPRIFNSYSSEILRFKFKNYCETQHFKDQKLSSSIFRCCSLFVPHR